MFSQSRSGLPISSMYLIEGKVCTVGNRNATDIVQKTESHTKKTCVARDVSHVTRKSINQRNLHKVQIFYYKRPSNQIRHTSIFRFTNINTFHFNLCRINVNVRK